jgi:hypothetical protein
VAAIADTEVPVQPHADDVVDSAPAARWAVQEGEWKVLAPALSDEVIALVAPPVTVSAL